MAIRVLCIAVLLSAASGASHEKPLVLGQTMLAGSTDCTSGSTGWALTSHGIAEKLFTVDSQGQIVGQVAKSVKKLDKFSWEVTLKSGYHFSEGTPVTAKLVADALTRLNEVNSGAQASLGKMTITPLDDLKLKIQSERATPIMESVLAEWAFAVHLKKGTEYFYTGPYAVLTFAAGDKFDLVPNPHYPRASERDPLTIKKFSDGQSLATAMGKKEIDMAFHLPVDSLPTLRSTDGVSVKSFLVGYQYMMWHNIRRSPLSDLKVRKAVDIALDRNELTQELRGGKGTRSFFPENTPYYLADTTLHADKDEAAKLLDEAGWKTNAAGKREKNGQPLTVRVVAYPQRPGLVTMQPVIKRNLEALGFTVDAKVTDGSSWDELDKIMADKDYDLLMWAQHSLPAGDPQFFINHFFRSDGGGNYAGLSSSSVDSLIDDLSHAEGASRVSAASNAHKAILDQVPVSVLCTPSWHVGLGSRLADYEPYGADYYIVHGDFGLTPVATPPDESEPTSDTANGAIPVTFNGLVLAILLFLGTIC
eukprot:gnl/TRDRNA2_/TRDRNA2_88633_c0_seq1.p1 gnl/TRDRNA2_/TRDRNA2_88633_c0~~gnl/TRDRNA2_/TRDRNA2_88633_c0_seq1.p1  ORF type:complete len:548 (+),score=60.68 gnl/TRDRNA2_/TRDRNA2_88633_c0_seq1:43-1644(+)